MRHRISVVAIAVIAVSTLVSGILLASGGDGRQPWENEDGTVDISKLPATENAIDRTGALVGVVKTSNDLADVYPLPVYRPGPGGELVGYLGENGFWALGETEGIIQDSYTIVEEHSASGELIHARTINALGEVTQTWTAGTINEETNGEPPQLPE